MDKIKNFYDLECWQKSHALVLDIYMVTKVFPRDEMFSLVSQLRRAVISIVANIAEGFGRYHYKDKIKFYYHSRGSAAEVHSLLFIAKDLKYLENVKFNKLVDDIDEIRRLINGLIRSLEAFV